MGVEVYVLVCYIIGGGPLGAGCGECRAVGCLWVYGWGVMSLFGRHCGH